jgi:hypothetical protein
MGAATCAVGATDAATASVVSALLAVLATNAFVVGTALDSVTVADDRVTVATASTTPTEVVGDDGVVAALTVAECAEFDSALGGVDVGCWVSDAGVDGGVLA